jgi:hypothetical protein
LNLCWMECLGLHNKPKAEVHPGHKLMGRKKKKNLLSVIPLAAVWVGWNSELLIPGFITLRLAPESTNTKWYFPSVSISNRCSNPVASKCDNPTSLPSVVGSMLGTGRSNPDHLDTDSSVTV